jgi:hypothetical protein
MNEYMTTAEAADYLRLAPNTVRKKMCAGILKEGEHFFRPPHGRPRFKESALKLWMEKGEKEHTAGTDDTTLIPQTRPYHRKRG